MFVINSVDSERFELDGIQYFKNFLSSVKGTKISIYNAYDRRDERIPLVLYTDIRLNGVVYGSAALLQAALLPVIYTRASLGPGDPADLPNIGRQVFDYATASIVIPSGAKVIDVQNMNNPGTVIGFTPVDPTHVTLDNGCETDDKIKLIYIF